MSSRFFSRPGAQPVRRWQAAQILTLGLALFVALGTSRLAAGPTASAGRASTAITIAVTGDIAPTGAKMVSDAILTCPEFAAVLLAGDTNNATPTPLESYQRLYAGTFDRFREKIFPAPETTIVIRNRCSAPIARSGGQPRTVPKCTTASSWVAGMW